VKTSTIHFPPTDALSLETSGLARVTAVVRSNYDIIKDKGVHFKSSNRGDIDGWRPYRLVRSVDEAANQAYSYVVVATKAIPDRFTTPSLLRPLLSSPYVDKYPQPTYVLFQNGINVEIDLYHAIKKLGKGEPRIISAAVYIFSNTQGPRIVEYIDFARVRIGVYRHQDFTTEKNSPEEAALLEDFGRILRAGDTTIDIVPEIQRVKFLKNVWNVVFSSFATLTRYRLPAIVRPPPSDPSVQYIPYVSPTTAELITTYTLPIIRATLEEVWKLGRAIGYPDTAEGIPYSAIDVVLNGMIEGHAKPENNHTPSMLVDLEQGRPIEVEVIVGEVVRMARERKVEVPHVEMLYALLLVVQNQLLRQLETSK